MLILVINKSTDKFLNWSNQLLPWFPCLEFFTETNKNGLQRQNEATNLLFFCHKRNGLKQKKCRRWNIEINTEC